jgi:hypothetical protein
MNAYSFTGIDTRFISSATRTFLLHQQYPTIAKVLDDT